MKRFLLSLVLLATLALGTSPAFALRSTVVTAALTNTVTAINPGYTNFSFMECYNPAAAATYVQVFNAVPGNVTLGTTPPATVISMATLASRGFAFSDNGLSFPVAMSVAATTTATGSTAPATALTCTFGYN